MMGYNITCIKAARGIGELALCANNSTGGILFGFGLLAFTIILLFAMKRYEFDNGMLAVSWLMFLISGILAYGGFLPILFPLGFLVVAAFTSLYIFTAKNY